MTKFFYKFKKNVFGPFLGQHFPPENPALSCATLYGFPAPCQNLGKTNDTIPRKGPDGQKDRRTERRKNRQTLFYRTLPVTTRGPKRHAFKLAFEFSFKLHS